MDGNNIKRPHLVSTLYLLLIIYGIIISARAIINVFSTHLPLEAWPLIAGPLLTSFISCGIAIAAGIAIQRKRRWGWWLAGIFLSSNLLGSILGFIQQFVMQINGQALYKVSPELFYSTIVVFIASFCLVIFLFSLKVREYLHVSDISIKKYIVKILGYGFLLLLLNTAIIILASFLNVLINK